jgi:hypothetical protein
VALYRARLGEIDRGSWWIDAGAIYLATIYPLVYWHAHLPRRFWWCLERDFAPLPEVGAAWLEPFYWLSLVLYAGKSGWMWGRGRGNPGKRLVVATTALCWHIGIITFNSDFAFTVTNVVIHGIPYMVLVYVYIQTRIAIEPPDRTGARPATWRLWQGWRGMLLFVGTLWLLAYGEELFWDRAVWHERSWLFGPPIEEPGWKTWLIPLLAPPQISHYVLDGFLWRRRQNRSLAEIAERG